MSSKGLSLLGFMSEDTAVEYLRRVAVIGDATDEELRALWVEARNRLGPPQDRAGYPDIQPIGQEYTPYLKVLKGTPHFQALVRGRARWSLGNVEIAPLLAYQPHVSGNAHGDLRRRKITYKEVLHDCLPVTPPVCQCMTETRGQSMRITSSDLNIVLQFLQPSSTQLPGIIVGVASPFALVCHFEGRYYLGNGYHRVARLLAGPNTRIPCLVWDVNSPEEIGIGPQTFSLSLLTSGNPPTCGHYAEAKAMSLTLRSAKRVIDINWSIDAEFE